MACTESDLGSSSVPVVDWTNLPTDLLDLILSKLVLIPDFIRFGAVCKEWFSIFLDQKHKRIQSIHQQPPILFIPVEGSDEHHKLCSVLEDNKVYRYPLPLPFNRRCCGTSFGWWALAGQDFGTTILINPFSSKTISLPPLNQKFELDIEKDPLDDYPYYPNRLPYGKEEVIHKVILSCDPFLYPDDYVVASIQGSAMNAGLIRPGDESWNHPCMGFEDADDIQFYKGRLYVLNHDTQLAAVDYTRGPSGSIDIEDPLLYLHEHLIGRDDYTGNAPMEYLITREPADDWYEESKVSYLVESLEGELLLVRRIRLWSDDRQEYDVKVTGGFKVYKLTETQKRSIDQRDKFEWVEIQSLGNSALFVGDNRSMCISATSFPNCKPNCIYSTDDYYMDRDLDDPYEAIDMGVYHMDSRQIEKLHELSHELRYKPPAVWMCPRVQ